MLLYLSAGARQCPAQGGSARSSLGHTAPKNCFFGVTERGDAAAAVRPHLPDGAKGCSQPRAEQKVQYSCKYSSVSRLSHQQKASCNLSLVQKYCDKREAGRAAPIFNIAALVSLFMRDRYFIFVGHYFTRFCYVQTYPQDVFISGIKYSSITWDQNNPIFNKKDRHLQGRRMKLSL